MRINFWNIVLFVSVVFVLLLTGNSNANEDYQNSKLDFRITKALLVIEDFMDSPDKNAVVSLIKNSAAIAIFPSVYKGAFFVGAQYGKGIMCGYDKKTGKWSAPAFFSIGGGSIGYQFGAQATDLILVITNKQGVESFFKDAVTLGGDVSIAAGPIGRQVQAETDTAFKAEIYSYSRSKGLFAGIALKGAVISPDNNSNLSFYGKSLQPADILLGNKVKPRESGIELISTIERFIR